MYTSSRNTVSAGLRTESLRKVLKSVSEKKRSYIFCSLISTLVFRDTRWQGTYWKLNSSGEDIMLGTKHSKGTLGAKGKAWRGGLR